MEKTIRILSLFEEVSPVLEVGDIANHLDIPQSTAYRYVSTLRAHGILERADAPASYRLGHRILQWARSIPQTSLQGIARPIMNQLSRETGEPVLLSALRGQAGVCLEKVEGQHALRVHHERGATFPLHAGATGKALMAFLPRAEQDVIITQMGLARFTKTTITDRSALIEELRRIRERGYATSNGEIIEDTYGIGAPVLDQDGRVTAALSISAPKQRLQGQIRRIAVAKLTHATSEITNRLCSSSVGQQGA